MPALPYFARGLLITVGAFALIGAAAAGYAAAGVLIAGLCWGLVWALR